MTDGTALLLTLIACAVIAFVFVNLPRTKSDGDPKEYGSDSDPTDGGVL